MNLNVPVTSLVQRSLFFEVTNSTNTQARLLVLSGKPWRNTIVLANYQTAGRGRLNRRWAAPPGSALLATLVLPSDQVYPATALLALSVAICRSLRERRIDAAIKYPNDIVSDGRKLCGILAETATDPTGETALLIGFGVNLSQSLEDFPPDLPYAASSVLLETGIAPQRDELLGSILTHFEGLLKLDRDAVTAAYTSLCSTLGIPLAVELNGEVLIGTATAVDSDGCLILLLADSNARRLRNTQIVRIHNL